MGSLLIKGGKIVTASEQYQADIYINNGVIENIEAYSNNTADQTIDAGGLLIFPGAVDPHVHLDMGFMGEVSADDYESGTAAALSGGTTTVIDFIIPDREQLLTDALKIWQKKSENAVADYSYHMSITAFNKDTAGEMKRCVNQEGISSFKVYLAYKDAIGVTDKELLATMHEAKKLGALVNCHCENSEMVEYLQNKLYDAGKTEPINHAYSRPSFVEGYGTHTAIAFAEATGCPTYIVHVTCKEAADEIARARARGLKIFGETCPQYLMFDESVYEKPNFTGAAYVMSPPIRPQGNQDALWGALNANSIEVIGTDHCPFRLKDQKTLGKTDFRKIPNGAGSIEERLKIMYTYGVGTGRITLNQFVSMCCTKPAQLYGMYPKKGTILAGADADLVLWDPEKKGTIRAEKQFQKLDCNIFEGFEYTGAPEKVIAGGVIRFENGNLNVNAGDGKFVRRQHKHL